MAALTILPKLQSTSASGPAMNRNALEKVSVLVSRTHDNDEEEQQNDISSGDELQESSLSTLIEQRIHLAITCKEKIIEETKRKRAEKKKNLVKQN